jgi:hypothetical protein
MTNFIEFRPFTRSSGFYQDKNVFRRLSTQIRVSFDKKDFYNFPSKKSPPLLAEGFFIGLL